MTRADDGAAHEVWKAEEHDEDEVLAVSDLVDPADEDEDEEDDE